MADAEMDDASAAIGQTSPAEGEKNRCCFQGCPSKGNKASTTQQIAK